MPDPTKKKKQTTTTNRYLGTFLKIGQAGVKKYVNNGIESGLITLTDNIIKFSNGTYTQVQAYGTMKHVSYYAEVTGNANYDATNNEINIAKSNNRNDSRAIATIVDTLP